MKQEKLDYIKNSVLLYGFKAQYFNSLLDEKAAGVQFKLRNIGTRVLTEVEVVVYFKDRAGNVISEERYFPVSATALTDRRPLKTGYIWQVEPGHFLTAKRVPSEWMEGNAFADITNIEFDH